MASNAGLVRGLDARMLSHPSQFQTYPVQGQEISGSSLAQPQHADGVPPVQQQRVGDNLLTRLRPQPIYGASPSIQMGSTRKEIARNLNFETYAHYFPVSLTNKAHLNLEYFGPFTGGKQLWRQVPRGTGNGSFSVVGNTSDFTGSPPTFEKPAFIWIGMIPGPHNRNPAGITTRPFNPNALRAIIKTPVKQGEWNLYGASNADVATGLCLLFKIENLLDVFWFRHPQVVDDPPAGVVLPRNCVMMHQDGYCMIFAAKILPAMLPPRVRRFQDGAGDHNAISSGNAQPESVHGIGGANCNGNATVNATMQGDDGKDTGKGARKGAGKRIKVSRPPVLRSSRVCCSRRPRAGNMILRSRAPSTAKSSNAKNDTEKVRTSTTTNSKSSISKMKTRMSSLTAAEMTQIQKTQADFLRRGGKNGVKKG